MSVAKKTHRKKTPRFSHLLKYPSHHRDLTEEQLVILRSKELEASQNVKSRKTLRVIRRTPEEIREIEEKARKAYSNNPMRLIHARSLRAAAASTTYIGECQEDLFRDTEEA
ncbi:MAG TPA: hypothetical protein VJJ80_03270 [Patescibacteria group bacterium]|nr:hypothetical protein [Patescibacteria group bacterium]